MSSDKYAMSLRDPHNRIIRKHFSKPIKNAGKDNGT